MPKKKIKPEQKFPLLWDIRDIDRSIKSLRKSNGKINGAITKMGWWKTTPLCRYLVQKTSFLDQDSGVPQRLYCYQNKIIEKPICTVSGKALKWSAQRNVYNLGGDAKISAKLRNRPRIDFEQVYSNRKQQFYTRYENGQYTLLSISDIKDEIDKRRVATKDGVLGKWVQMNDYSQNVDFLASVLDYCREYQGKIQMNDWSQKFYIIYNDIIDKVPTRSDGNLCFYKNFKQGYATSIRPLELSKKQYYKNTFLSSLQFQGFDVLQCDFESINKRTTVRCRKCGKQFSTVMCNGRYRDVRCVGCCGSPNTSRVQDKVASFISQMGFEIIQNDRDILDGKQIDIYIPSKRIGIQINGLLWHSFGTTYPNNSNMEKFNKSNHNQKYKKCSMKGIHLLQFSDDDVVNKWQIVKSVISNKLGVSSNKIYGRKCQIVEIDINTKSKFLIDNHMLGDCQSTYNYGLFYDGQLVSVMTFGKRKITKGQASMEMLRFCNKCGFVVVGGASKLFCHFLKNTCDNRIISYSDNRISNGDLYEKLGFNLLRQTKYNYWYVEKSGRIHHRSKFMKHKLNTDMSQRDYMFTNGYRRYYDCGHKVFEFVR